MKGVSGKPALDAYQRMAVSPVGGARRPAPVAETEATPAHAAKVSISSEARTRATGAAEGHVDAQKVSSLKAKVNDGTYRVDSRLVASRMLDHAS